MASQRLRNLWWFSVQSQEKITSKSHLLSGFRNNLRLCYAEKCQAIAGNHWRKMPPLHLFYTNILKFSMAFCLSKLISLSYELNSYFGGATYRKGTLYKWKIISKLFSLSYVEEHHAILPLQVFHLYTKFFRIFHCFLVSNLISLPC